MTAPGRLLLRRLVNRRFWHETKTTRPTAGPTLDVLDRRDAQAPVDGAGPMNHRRYRVTTSESSLGAEALLERFRRDPNRFAPTSFARFEPDPAPEGLAEGQRYAVTLPGPWDGPIVVRSAAPSHLTLETREGHMEAGRIEFRTHTSDTDVVFTIESFARSGDQIFDALYHRLRIGKLVQTEMWVQVLEAAVSVSGGQQVGDIEVDTTIYEGANT